MRRRDFIKIVAGSAAAWPLAADAQPAAPTIGYLHSAIRDTVLHFVSAFRSGLSETGFIEGQNLAVEYRFAEGDYDRLPALAADLVSRQVAVIVASGGDPPALAVKAATATIPIVFTCSTDPVKLGLVTSLNRPGGNATGVSGLTSMMLAKRLELIRELVSPQGTIAALVNPSSVSAEAQSKDVRAAAEVYRHRLIVLTASTGAEIAVAFATLTQQHAVAIIVDTDAFFLSRREQFSRLEAQFKIPAIYAQREFPVAGSLMSYGVSLSDINRQLGVYAGRILKGEKPSEIPVEQPTKFELVINLKTARALGIAVPLSLLGRADQVIE